MTRNRPSNRRPAVAIIAFVTALLVIGITVLWSLQLTATGSISYLAHYNSTGAFYAAESGFEMAIREISDGNDIDSDGVIGTISDNADTTDDPGLGSGSFSVQAAADTLTSTGRWRDYLRVIEVELE